MCTEEKTDFSGRPQYAGRWVALLNDRVIGVGESRHEAYQAARKSRSREAPTAVVHVQGDGALGSVDISVVRDHFAPGTLAGRMREMLLAATDGVYLVGGSVRDFLLGRECHDLDLTVAGNALNTGRAIADELGAAYYPVDSERGVARVVFRDAPAGAPTHVDIAVVRDGSIEADLSARDFTVNAMAVDMADWALIDLNNGQDDLKGGRMRLVSHDAIRQDPIRALRGVRQASELSFTLCPDTLDVIRRDGNLLVRVSRERIQEEWISMLTLPAASGALGWVERLGLLNWTIPELAGLHDVTQTAPHRLNVWEHSLLVVTRLEGILRLLWTEQGVGSAAHLPAALTQYRQQLRVHLEEPLAARRPRWVILKLAALLHDVAKPACREIDETGRARFLGHDQQGAEVAANVAQQLRLSGAETDMLSAVVRYHMRPLLLAQSRGVTRRSAHRFYRDAGSAGIDVALLSLADHLALKPGKALSPGWEALVEVVDDLLRYWLEAGTPETVSPLVKGGDLIAHCHLEPGPKVGYWLRRVREEQVCGVLQSREAALQWVLRESQREAKNTQ